MAFIGHSIQNDPAKGYGRSKKARVVALPRSTAGNHRRGYHTQDIGGFQKACRGISTPHILGISTLSKGFPMGPSFSIPGEPDVQKQLTLPQTSTPSPHDKYSTAFWDGCLHAIRCWLSRCHWLVYQTPNIQVGSTFTISLQRFLLYPFPGPKSTTETSYLMFG